MFQKLPITKTSKFLKKFFKPEIYSEAYVAYVNRLPSEITVHWFRDGDMIIGKVQAGDKEFMTQGANEDDFIRMINESVFTIFNIPNDYFDVVRDTRSFKPSEIEMARLKDPSVISRSFGTVRNDLMLQPA